ncbi:MAG: PhnD/SsuA/transferrin family substrate-binding protein [Prochlorococcaceae cyanobacterium]
MAWPSLQKKSGRIPKLIIWLGGLAGVAFITLFVPSCSDNPSASSRKPLCGPNGILRVGLMDLQEGQEGGINQIFSDDDIEGLRTLLMQASQCEVQLEPLSSTERARSKLAARGWDAAFLPPGLSAFALSQTAGYSPLRILGGRQTARSSILVLDSSRFRSLADLQGSSVGLLPRGSLTGFYLPLYNMHGLTLSRVSFGLNYADLLNKLEKGEVAAIAWDESLPPPSLAVRRLMVDSHAIPLGALVLSGGLTESDYVPFLKALDASSGQMPPAIGYAAGILPDQKEVQPLKAIVESVESWAMPLESQVYRVFGEKPGG